ncbi:MAG: flagellar hook-basal body complex protein FliE [Phycisphaerae bacterium]|nr:flagellar hook-basal body complex protein FliE [Phycisphaerae bacterium]HAW96514.1 flagellar hook-basal body complex protein FliE [Phycisphaerales bacterium]|tara:strand:- start:687 stop:1013 length:327 start_codon:yes stop_codon:yes gene_type:complete
MHDPIGHISGSNGPGSIGPITPKTKPGVALGPGGNGKSFVDELKGQLAEVNRLQAEADVAAEDLVAGRRDDLEGVMIATEKADTAFKMVLAVRNKLVDAYEEVKNLRV